jgi:UDP-N-acetylmuramoyl-L-alanyl-D-glutamate--2,6-diaminopimelate ligase
MSAVMNQISSPPNAPQPSSAKVPRRIRSMHYLMDGIVAWPGADIDVDDMTLDSRAVVKNGLFLAVQGLRSHGLAFASQAIANGASVIVWEPSPGIDLPALPSNVRAMAVPRLSKVVGELADRFFDSPSAQLTIAGVTGTNGKTTSAYMIPAALAVLRQRAAYVGTIGFGDITALQSTQHTTSDCITVHRQLASMRDACQTHVGMEVSSHALDQGRIDGVRVHTALFTNLTQDHLDYHGTFEAYGAAKERLFNRPELQHAVINTGDAFGRALAGRFTKNNHRAKLTVFAVNASDAVGGDRQLFTTRVVPVPGGMQIHLEGSWGSARLNAKVIGGFNVENLLGVLAVLLGWNIPLDNAVQALEQCNAPPGRMEIIAVENRPVVVVDYAHTPDALSKALQTARLHCQGRLICVFGCGGERDAGKRPQMGQIASQLAEAVIVTDDNPRKENADQIVADILRGIVQGAHVMVERDRERAIALALNSATPNDLILIAGKGHEDYQLIGDRSLPFSDRDVAKRLLEQAA